MGPPDACSRAIGGTLDFGVFWPKKTLSPYFRPPETEVFIAAQWHRNPVLRFFILKN